MKLKCGNKYIREERIWSGYEKKPFIVSQEEEEEAEADRLRAHMKGIRE